MDQLFLLWQGTGIYQMELNQLVMIGVGLLLLYLAISRGFEPLLLVPIGFGGILANIPGVDIAISTATLEAAPTDTITGIAAFSAFWTSSNPARPLTTRIRLRNGTAF